MKLYINADYYRYLDRCWPLMPADWSAAAGSSEFVEVELDTKDRDELLRYMSMDQRYSESDDDERKQALTYAMHAFILAQIDRQNADIISFPHPLG